MNNQNNPYNLKVGQELYVVISNRGNIKTEFAKINKLGNKYFYLEGGRYNDRRFYLKNLREDSNITSRFSLYFSEEQYNEIMLSSKLAEQIKDYFAYGTWSAQRKSVTLDQLKKIAEILGIEYEETNKI